MFFNIDAAPVVEAHDRSAGFGVGDGRAVVGGHRLHLYSADVVLGAGHHVL